VSPKIRRSQDGDNLKVGQIVPAADPGRERFLVRSFHNLKALGSRRLQPTVDVRNILGKHPAKLAEAFSNGPWIAILKPLNNHEEHKEVYVANRIIAGEASQKTGLA
jgi:hypothetical protein